MPKVALNDGCIWIGDERVPLYAGEVHYWRLNPARWSEVLDRVREIGLGVVATYVPWQYHELAPGQFDFTGRTEPPRNLVGFLGLLREKGFRVFIRPGPYIYAEWVNAGVPDRVVTMPRLSEEYRREARGWMQAVTEVLRPFFATSGGPICLFQPDNEMDLFSHWFEDRCGLDGTQAGFLQQFMRETYLDVAGLNRAWGAAYHSLEEVQAFAEPVDPRDPHMLVRRKDYWRFQHWAVREAMRWHVEEYRRLGVDLPMVANYYPGGDVQNWRELSKVVDFLGIDWYTPNAFGGRADEQRRFLDTCRYQRTLSSIPFIAEFGCGVWHGYHEQVGVLTPNHYRLTAFSALLAGIQAFNWYMLVARDNWYYSPINERGEWRPELAEVFKGHHRIVRECDPPRLRKLTDAAVLIEPIHIATDRILEDNAVLAALHEADVDYEVFDPEVGRIEKPVMFYAAADWLSKASQQRLNEYMERGGTLAVFRDYPRRDENFQPHNGLAVAPPDRVLSKLGKQVEVAFGDVTAVGTGAVWCWDRPPGELIWGTQVAGRQQAVENADKWMTNYIGRRWICGYRQPRGRGALVVIGLPANAELARGVMRWLGLPLYARAALPGVKTGLFARDDGRFYLFATNLNTSDVQCRVELDSMERGWPYRATDLWTGEERMVLSSSGAVTEVVISLPARSGGAWELKPA